MQTCKADIRHCYVIPMIIHQFILERYSLILQLNEVDSWQGKCDRPTFIIAIVKFYVPIFLSRSTKSINSISIIMNAKSNCVIKMMYIPASYMD